MQYKIKSGDWLSKIASKYGMTWQELYEYDGGTGKSNKERLNEQKRNKGRPESSIDNPSSIYPDDVILIPDTAEGVVSAVISSFKARVTATKMHPRITVVGAIQADRASYPDDKTGGPVVHAFLGKLKSAKSANEAAKLAGAGAHTYGSLTLDPKLFQEPTYVDSGTSVSMTPGKAIVIGNDDNDEKVKMGSYGPQNRKLDKSVADASKMESALKQKQFSVTSLPNQTGQKLKTVVQNAASSLRSSTTFVFYFSGHGTIEGLVGTDGAILPPADLVALVKKVIEVDSDLVILCDACHSGIVVDECRLALLERAKEHYKNNSKMTAFVEAAIDLAGAKSQFMKKTVLDLWKKEWLAGDLLSSKDQNDIDRGSKLNDEFYGSWFKAWNDFVDAAQTKISDAVQKGKAAGLKTQDLTLKKFTEKEMAGKMIEQEQQKQIWAQLDSLDEIMNLAVSTDK